MTPPRDADDFAVWAKACLDMADDGALPVFDGLVLAEMCGRFAVSLGGVIHLRGLADIYLLRAAYAHRNGAPGDAVMFEAHALRRLQQGDDAGIEACSERLVDVIDKVEASAVEVVKALAAGDGVALQASYDDTFARAARGDQAAMAVILDEADAARRAGTVSERECAVISENLSILAPTDPHVRRRIAGCRMIRAGLDIDAGNTTAGIEGHALALRELASLVEAGVAVDLSVLAAACAAVGPQSVALAAIGDASLLAALPPQGNA